MGIFLRCLVNVGYIDQLTVGKRYCIIRVSAPIIGFNSYYVLIDDKGNEIAAHARRFEDLHA